MKRLALVSYHALSVLSAPLVLSAGSISLRLVDGNSSPFGIGEIVGTPTSVWEIEYSMQNVTTMATEKSNSTRHSKLYRIPGLAVLVNAITPAVSKAANNPSHKECINVQDKAFIHLLLIKLSRNQGCIKVIYIMAIYPAF